jgi:UDP-N-acetyl-D-galactosamine dehydrogenase
MIEKLLKPGGGVVLDVKDMLDRAGKPQGVELWRL